MSGRQPKEPGGLATTRNLVNGKRITSYRIGDCFAVRGIGEATEQATSVARDLANLWL